jgi:hypothetical protein
MRSDADAERLAIIERKINAKGVVQIEPPVRRIVAYVTYAVIALLIAVGFVSAAVCAFLVIVATLAGGITNLALRLRDDTSLTFLPEGIIATRIQANTVVVLSYADIEGVARDNNRVVVQAGNRTMRLMTSERHPDDALLDDLQAYLEAKVTEARALADTRAAVDVFLRENAAGGPDYRHPAPPTSALETIAHARVMPMKLRVDAAHAMGEEEEALEVSEELKALESVRRT